MLCIITTETTEKDQIQEVETPPKGVKGAKRLTGEKATQLVTYMPMNMIIEMNDISEELGISRSAFVKIAVAEKLEKMKKE